MTNAIELDFPDLDLSLELPERFLMLDVARKMATAHKKALRRGVDSTGRSVQRGDDGGRALYDSGDLIRSIKGYTKKRKGREVAIVGATGQRSDLGASLRGRSAGLLGVQIHGLKTEANRPRNPTLMATSRSLEAVAAKAFDASLEKQFARGKARFVDRKPRGLFSRRRPR